MPHARDNRHEFSKLIYLRAELVMVYPLSHRHKHWDQAADVTFLAGKATIEMHIRYHILPFGCLNSCPSVSMAVCRLTVLYGSFSGLGKNWRYA